MGLDIVGVPLLLGTVLILAFFCTRIARDPKIALYVAIFTAPVTQRLGEGAFLQRLAISDIMGVLFIFTWFVNTQSFRRRLIRLPSPLNPYVSLLVYVLGLSLLVNLVSYNDIVGGVEEFAVIFYLSLFYFTFTKAITTDQEVQRILDIWLVAAVFVVGVGLWDSLGNRLLGLPQIIGPVKEGDEYRVAATFKTTGQLGVYLLSTFFIALARYFLPDSSKRTRTGLTLLMAGVVLLSIFASRRSTYVAFLVGLAAFLIVKVKDPKALISGLIICIASFAVVTTFLNQDEDFSKYFQSRVRILTPGGVQSDEFIQLQGQSALKAFTENPIIGIGIGRFWGSEYDLTGNEIHSTYAQLLAETGILGSTVYAFFMLMLVRLTYETAFRMRDPKWSAFCGVLFAAFFGFGVSYSYNRHLRERSFWILVGVIVCIQRLAKARTRLIQQRRREAALARARRVQAVMGAS
jgi:O-antigen ligase